MSSRRFSCLSRERRRSTPCIPNPCGVGRRPDTSVATAGARGSTSRTFPTSRPEAAATSHSLFPKSSACPSPRGASRPSARRRRSSAARQRFGRLRVLRFPCRMRRSCTRGSRTSDAVSAMPNVATRGAPLLRRAPGSNETVELSASDRPGSLRRAPSRAAAPSATGRREIRGARHSRARRPRARCVAASWTNASR
jgi:hypothetical protein